MGASPMYELPTFNLLASVWRNGHVPNAVPADLVNIPCQLYLNSRYFIIGHESDLGYYVPEMLFRFPIPSFSPQFRDIYQIQGRTYQYYAACWAERMHPGFINEYFIVHCVQSDDTASVPRQHSKWDTMT